MSEDYKEYFLGLEKELTRLYRIASEAKEKGLDITNYPEPEITHDIAERVEMMIGPNGLSQRIRELEQLDRREIAFKIAEEITHGRFGSMEKVKAADQAIRTGLAIMTEGVTIAPIEGIPKIVLKQNPDRSQFLSIYFAGPIRPAGGTAQALTLILADHVRKLLGLEKWQPSEEAVQRFIEEVRVYERSVRRFQYHVTDEDLEFAMRQMPVEPTGVSTDQFEVSNYRDIPGIETNRLRGGALIVVVDGVVGRARKLYGNCEKLGVSGWDWLNRMGKTKSKEDNGEAPTAAFMDEIIVGRPVFSFPGAVGGFRLRYGRARNTGLAAVGVHPATMIVLNKFLTTGVQMRTELPGKSAATCPVDSLEPPIVKLKNGSVIRVENQEDAQKIFIMIEKILYLGDYLSNAGDFIQNNKPLLPSGYDENQWLIDLNFAYRKFGIETSSNLTGLLNERIEYFLKNITHYPTPKEAISLTILDIPLHPRYNYNWSVISKDELLALRTNLLNEWHSKTQKINYDQKIKTTIEKLLIPHKINEGFIDFEDESIILEKCLHLDKPYIDYIGNSSFEVVNNLAGFTIKEKAPIFVGARMGRPEKAKERKMAPLVHSLFPVSEAGGPQRDIVRVEKGKKVKVEITQRKCKKCGVITYLSICRNCGGETEEIRRCSRCGLIFDGNPCPKCNGEIVSYANIDIDLREQLEGALRHVGGVLPSRIKCVKKLMNETRTPEHLGKGLLRARYDLSVFKDGTLRYDLTDVPLTHFKLKEIGISIEQLKNLGYKYDVEGEPLTNPDQILELKVQDVILPESCGEYLVKASRFLDDMLRDFYKLPPYYNAKKRDDLVGCLLLGLAPHTSAAIIGRLIGFTKVRNQYAHPLWHAAKRRNCDGDEDAVLLVLDPLLNFSKAYLPQQSGGLMDAPLYIIPTLNPGEVDKEAHNLDVVKEYPREFYKLCSEGAETSELQLIVDTIGARLGTEAQFEGIKYTHECSDINLGSHIGSYTSLSTMIEKLDSQLELAKKIQAVDAKEVALRILNSHFMKDIVGNLRAFTNQTFRCTKCNRIYRRPPLLGKCQRCGGPIQLTVHKGGIEKYLDPAIQIVKKYDLDDYYMDRLNLVKEEIQDIFIEEEKPIEEPSKQFSLTDFMRREPNNKENKETFFLYL